MWLTWLVLLSTLTLNVTLILAAIRRAVFQLREYLDLWFSEREKAAIAREELRLLDATHMDVEQQRIKRVLALVRRDVKALKEAQDDLHPDPPD